MQSSSSPAWERIWAAFVALLLGQAFVVAPIYGVWRDHWLVRDGQEGTAVITKEHWAGHGVMLYQYRVGQRMYTGQDRRSSQNPKYAHVMPGEQSVVYFSASHPWISAINVPHQVVINGLPVVLLAWLFEALLLITAIDPRNRWALRQRPVAEKSEGGRRDEEITRAARRSPLQDILRLVGYAVLVVLGMAALEIAINGFFGRK